MAGGAVARQNLGTLAHTFLKSHRVQLCVLYTYMISTHLIELILARWIQTFELAATFTHSEVFTELSRRRDKKSYKCFNIYQMLGNLVTHVGRITVDGLAPERLGVIANAEAAHTRAGNVEHAVVHLVALKVHAVFLQCHCMEREKGREGLRN